jgi:mRNA-degrading endonuclease RelE of RelBE toxin-antitoxin system
VTARYTITYAPRARRDLRKPPEKIAAACVEFIRTTLAEDPYRMGKPLISSWEGNYSSRPVGVAGSSTASMIIRSSSNSSS